VKIFSVPDFVGDACKAIGAKVRGSVTQTTFEDFHKYSAKIIRTAVFGMDETTGHIAKKFFFPSNHLVITNIDIQSVEPVDQRTRESLNKSVQLAIEITTSSLEASAKHEAQRLEQEAKGMLDRQRIKDESETEGFKRELLQLKSMSAAVETTGQATSEAKARAESSQIEGESNVILSKLKSESMKILAEGELEENKLKQEIEIQYLIALDELELDRARELGTLEAKKFSDLVSAIGSGTIAAIAESGPEYQNKLLQALGLETVIITDGSVPLNLFTEKPNEKLVEEGSCVEIPTDSKEKIDG